MEQRDYILGLDIGTNYIGWSVLACNIEQVKEADGHDEESVYHPVALIDCNSRIFQEAVALKTRVPKNQIRRDRRGERRMQWRFRRRRDHLLRTLRAEQMFPQENTAANVNKIDKGFAERIRAQDGGYSALDERTLATPYAMRAIGLDQRLQPYEFGRVLLQLIKHRGYFSNRGAKYLALDEYLRNAAGHRLDEQGFEDTGGMDNKDKKDEGKKVLAGIRKTEERMGRRGARTVGEYIFQRARAEGIPPQRIGVTVISERAITANRTDAAAKNAPPKETEYTLATTRARYKEEFEALWRGQVRHGFFAPHSNKEVAKLKEKVEHIMYWQRPLKTQKGAVGACSYEPHKKRVPKAALEYQEARLWQCINNIKHNDEPLSAEHRQTLYEAAKQGGGVNKDGRISWNGVAKILAIKRQVLNYRDIVTEDGASLSAKSGVVTNRTHNTLRQSELLGGRWDDFSEKEQKQFVEDMLTIHDKRALYRRLIRHWRCAPGIDNLAYRLATTELEDGYGKHCYKVLRLLLPYLQRGMRYDEALGAAGYERKDERVAAAQDYITPQSIPNVANPVVQKALYEVAKVVNAIIERYGRPSLVRVELARNVKASKQHRKEIISAQHKNLVARVQAEQRLSVYLHKSKQRYIPPSKRLLNRYMLYEEQECRCMYCNKKISMKSLIDGEADVDHITPRTLFPQNKGNTVLACKACNLEKGSSKTPYEVWGGTDFWKRLVARLDPSKNQSNRKIQRILSNKEEREGGDIDEFVKRQLNDTKYISVMTKNVLEGIGIPVRVIAGGATSRVAKAWQVYRHLPPHPDEQVVTTYLLDPKTGELPADGAPKSTKWANPGVWRWNAKRGKWRWSEPQYSNIPPGVRGNYTSAYESKGGLFTYILDEERKQVIGRKKWSKKKYNALSAEQRRSFHPLSSSGDVKQRNDYRRHAINAVVVALSNKRLYEKIIRRRRELNTLPDSKRTSLDFDALFPTFTGGITALHSKIAEIFSERAVSHQKRHRIIGALHNENVYGRGRYYTWEPLTRGGGQAIEKLVSPGLAPDKRGDIDRDGKVKWIANSKDYEMIRRWVMGMRAMPKSTRATPKSMRATPKSTRATPKSTRTLPTDESGNEIEKIRVANRCYVRRQLLNKKVIESKVDIRSGKGRKKVERARKDSFIYSDATYASLVRWKKRHRDGNYDELLKTNPPRMIRKNGTRRGNVIKAIRYAHIIGDSSVLQVRPKQFVKYESNHHIAIFEQILEQGDESTPKRRCDCVTMYEAAQRVQRGGGAFQKHPPAEWRGGWRHVMHLGRNDIVELDRSSSKGKPELHAQQGLTPSYYRVQQLNESKIVLRHCSVSAAVDSDKHGLILKTPNSIRCKKVTIDLLGGSR